MIIIIIIIYYYYYYTFRLRLQYFTLDDIQQVKLIQCT